MWVLPDPALGVGYADGLEQLDCFSSFRSDLDKSRRCAAMVSSICRPMVSTGFKDVIGSWNTMPMLLPRI